MNTAVSGVESLSAFIYGPVGYHRGDLRRREVTFPRASMVLLPLVMIPKQECYSMKVV